MLYHPYSLRLLGVRIVSIMKSVVEQYVPMVEEMTIFALVQN